MGSALKFFKRSLQVNSNFVYAHTLCGHEYQSNEDFEKAVACYRKALEIHPRHYKAWYGMGTIYLRQEKYQMAEYHFRRAVRINPRNSVLFCYMGMVRLHEAREKRDIDEMASDAKYEEALKAFAKAEEIEPDNPQAKFHRASVYIDQERYRDAVADLMLVRDSAPKEVQVYLQLGECCKRIADHDTTSKTARAQWLDRAMRHYNTALDLDPKEGNVIKAAIEELHEAYGDDDDDEEEEEEDDDDDDSV